LIQPTQPNQQQQAAWPEAGLRLIDGFYSAADSYSLFQQLMDVVDWQQLPITVYGKTWPEPRLTSWVGDPDAVYSYSGQARRPVAWFEPLSLLREQISAQLGLRFNSVLVNCYQDGSHGVGWHSDDEPELGAKPTIASLSLGSTRRFRVRHKSNQAIAARSFDLRAGNLLVMDGNSQRDWQHAVPKVKSAVGPRINLTFRLVGPSLA
jgi:alkylated DNA repair dioxygenase AlkB